ncbi:minichromosome maintenance domain-containing protein 2 [Uranotaenia lowii]|uniref:minichromosome maintenance domain-containing protein 2 n=1 Tax=Uranotaenia lowii TaxID=190385 RepID=UPI0024788709|nr:minichromosome maintenance domain-containing protein 2 [Uranotaenia lowii]
MESAMGLFCDPDECRKTMDRSSSDDTEQFIPVDIFVLNDIEKISKIVEFDSSAEIDRKFFDSENNLTASQGSQNLNDNYVFMKTEHGSEPEMDTQSLSLTTPVRQLEDDKEAVIDNTIHPTNNTDCGRDAQGWSFSQMQSTFHQMNSQYSSQTSKSPEKIPIPFETQLSQSQMPNVKCKEESMEHLEPMYQELADIPESIRSLYSSVTEKYSEFCYTYMLSAQLCSKIVPTNCYNHLKLCLLLSIASIQQSASSAPFHVIGLGPDSSVTQLIMRSIGKLGRRFTNCMVDAMAGGRVLEDNFVECGSTTLARTGVCFIGDWSMQRPSNATTILREIESGQIIIENHPITYPLECSIWTCWNYTRKAKQDLSALVMFLNAFGIPIVLPEHPPDDLIDFILEGSLLNYEESNGNQLVPETDVQQLIGILYFQEVNVSEETSKLLSDYFVVTRSHLPESLTQASLLALGKIAEAHARLCFRSETNRLDAVVAILICEKFIQSVFNCPTKPTLQCDTNIETIEDLEQHFHRFNAWLKEFLGTTVGS